MNKFFDKIKFWLNNSRPYSIPITLLSWLVIFVYSLKNNGNALLGVIALIGISLVHLATNLSDDYFDYIRLVKDERFLSSAKDCKCKYLKEGNATISDLRNVIIIMLGISAIAGGVLFFTSGWGVIIFALIGLAIALSYSFLSSNGLGDVAVILAYGPLMFEGVYYVMCKEISFEVLILSFACAMFVNAILYTHMLMDYDEDVISYKTTLCTLLKTKKNALNFLILFYLIGYIMVLWLFFIKNNYLYFFSYCTIPLVWDLYRILNKYNHDKTSVPDVKIWYRPLDNWEKTKNSPNAPFLLRFMFSRNISVWFMLIMCIAIILKG